MKKLIMICAVLIATTAHAKNKYPFVNAKYIDETTPWAEIFRTWGYLVKAPATYIAENVAVNVMNTCQREGNLYAWITEPVWGAGSDAGVVGVKWKQVQVPPTRMVSVCTGEGTGSACNPQYFEVDQKIRFSFEVPVKAVNYKDNRGIQFEWGTAFTKNFTVPACE